MNEAALHEVEPSVSPIAPEGYRLGDPIALEDLLALPPDGRRYTRDAEERLRLMAPDDPRWHRYPIAALIGWLHARKRPPQFVAPEPGIAFSRITTLQGRTLPVSRLGPRTLEPDAVVFSKPPGFVFDKRGRARGFDPSLIRLVVEVLSPGTHRQDVGLGSADEVDRFRSYLESGAPEYWILNPHPDALALPPRTGLFLRATGDRWEALPGADLVHAPGSIHGFAPLVEGRIHSPALDQAFDLSALWSELLPAE